MAKGSKDGGLPPPRIDSGDAAEPLGSAATLRSLSRLEVHVEDIYRHLERNEKALDKRLEAMEATLKNLEKKSWRVEGGLILATIAIPVIFSVVAWLFGQDLKESIRDSLVSRPAAQASE